MAEKQVKSRQRVADHGEVFTAEREVKAMCDLVKSETERIDSRFLEPACGDGNFLAEILRRKLAIVKQNYAPRRGSCHYYELYADGQAHHLCLVDVPDARRAGKAPGLPAGCPFKREPRREHPRYAVFAL